MTRGQEACSQSLRDDAGTSGTDGLDSVPMSDELEDEYHQEVTPADRTPSPWSDMDSSSSSGRSSHNLNEAKAELSTVDAFDAERREQKVYINTNVEVLVRIHTAIKRSGLKFRNKRADEVLLQDEKAFRLLQHEEGDLIALSRPCGEHEMFRRYLARLVLANGYVHGLLQRLNHENHEERRANQDLPPWRRVVHIILRSYFYDPARLTIVQRRLVDANVVRRNRMIHAGSLFRPRRIPEVQDADWDRGYDSLIQPITQVPTETPVTVQPARAMPGPLILSTFQSNAEEKKPVSSFIAQPATELGSVFSITGALMSPRSNRTAATKMSARVGHLDYPKCPAQHGHFSCPYCPNVLSDEYTRRDKWRYVAILPFILAVLNDGFYQSLVLTRSILELTWHKTCAHTCAFSRIASRRTRCSAPPTSGCPTWLATTQNSNGIAPSAQRLDPEARHILKTPTTTLSISKGILLSHIRLSIQQS